MLRRAAFGPMRIPMKPQPEAEKPLDHNISSGHWGASDAIWAM
jgi:hypothetical protein